jgi:coproporphyrinogen III oxidase
MRDVVIPFLKQLRENIIARFELIEKDHRFTKTPWNHHTGGGGEIGLLRGDCFEKAAVNFSAVHGDVFPLEGHSGPFFATGISLITHMANPHAPTVHMNLRYIETATESWLGGGYDLTPMGFPYQEDTDHFHAIAKATLNPFGPHLYPEFSANADQYFYNKHRKKTRGVGGLFFDHYRTKDSEQDLAMWQSVGNTFLDAIIPIYERRILTPYTAEEKEKQLTMRGHYVEFNLLYDRGTMFGFRSGGNPEAILCSMPPLVKW